LVVGGKSIIFMTTNGSPVMAAGNTAQNLFIAGFVNLTAVVNAAKSLPGDIMIVCAGKENRFCIEDAVCAGKIVAALGEHASFELDDAAQAALALDKGLGKNIVKMLKNSEHGKYLREIGFEADVELCGALDSIPILPKLSKGIIRIADAAPKKKLEKAVLQ
jgi:2-phosphosulfolactate phosphatase